MQTHDESNSAAARAPTQPSTPAATLNPVFGAAPRSNPHWKREWSPRSLLKGTRDIGDAPRTTQEERLPRLASSAFESTFLKKMLQNQVAAAASVDFVDGLMSSATFHDRDKTVDSSNATATASEVSVETASALANEAVPNTSSSLRSHTNLTPTAFFVGSTFSDFDNAAAVSREAKGCHFVALYLATLPAAISLQLPLNLSPCFPFCSPL
jgi:hypothetical protein